MEILYEPLLLLFVVALVAGWVDALAGGGGMITIPALLLAGIPPASAIATNKLQGSFGTAIATFYFLRRRTISIGENWIAIICVGLGSVLGGWILLHIDSTYIKFLVPLLLVLIGIYFLFFASNLDKERKAKLSKRSFDITVSPCLGFYDGFFGPGTGSFMSTAFVTIRGIPIREATAKAKLLNFTSNFSALIYFIFFGEIFFFVGFVMMLGQLVGSYLGARTAYKGGSKIIRPITIIVCFVMSVRVLWDLV